MAILYVLLALVFIIFLYVFFLAICSLFINPQKEYSTNSRFYRFLLNSASIAALKLLRIKVHTSGLEKISTDERPLFVCNHRSNYDPIITWCVFRRWQIAFISKASNFKIPIFGRFIRKCCFMAIDRESPRKAITTINKASELLKTGEVSIGIYPEGTRSKSGELLPFHNGVFKIAQKAEKPIVVLSITGTEKIARNLLKLKASHVYLDVLQVIPNDEVKKMKTDRIGELVREEITKKQRVQSKKELCKAKTNL